jgi:RimJ/RimL family protein N-acetyltransferase
MARILSSNSFRSTYMKYLRNDEIELIPYNIEHIPFFEKWRTYYSFHFFSSIPPSYDMLKEGYNVYLKEAMDGKKRWFIILEKNAPSHHPIGMIGINDIDYKNGTCEVGQMFIHQDRRGHGYMQQAINLILHLCFEELRMENVHLWTLETNIDALKCYEQCGFQKAGVLRGGFHREGCQLDLVLMDITRDDYYDQIGETNIQEFEKNQEEQEGLKESSNSETPPFICHGGRGICDSFEDVSP